MVRDGIIYALGFTAAGIFVGWLLGPAVALPLYVLGAFCAWFFRDPERPIPVGPVAVSPADGKVVAVASEGDGVTRIRKLRRRKTNRPSSRCVRKTAHR